MIPTIPAVYLTFSERYAIMMTVKGKTSRLPMILTNERVNTMNAILNKATMAVLVCDDYQYEYDYSFRFEWQDESFTVLRTNTGTCSASPYRGTKIVIH